MAVAPTEGRPHWLQNDTLHSLVRLQRTNRVACLSGADPPIGWLEKYDQLWMTTIPVVGLMFRCENRDEGEFVWLSASGVAMH